jgi:hypothetical protein
LFTLKLPPSAQTTPARLADTVTRLPAGLVSVTSEAAADPKPAAELEEINRQVAALQEKGRRLKTVSHAMGVMEAKPRDVRIEVKGDFQNLGDSVPRGFLSAVKVRGAAPVDPKSSGRRELAGWIAHPANPLTARVAVNRVWMHLFGRGLVATPDDFGVTGARPTHPGLLDHLADRFVREHRWSLKKMVRELVLTRAYALAATPAPANLRRRVGTGRIGSATPRRRGRRSRRRRRCGRRRRMSFARLHTRPRRRRRSPQTTWRRWSAPRTPGGPTAPRSPRAAACCPAGCG